MPIDYAAQKKAAEQRVNSILAGRPQQISDELAQTGTNIGQQRNHALGDELGNNLSSIGQRYNLGGIGTDTDTMRRTLASNLNTNLSGQKMQLNQDRLNAVYNQATGLAQNAGYNRQAAEDFARQHMNLDIQQQQQAWLNQFNRDQNVRLADIGENFVNQGISLDNQYNTPQTDYQSSLMRVLTGLPVQIGTSYYLNKMMQPSTPYGGNLPTNNLNNMAYANSMPFSTGTAFSSRINPMTGRRG